MEKCGRCYPNHRSTARNVFFAIGLLFDHFAVTRQYGDDAGKVLLITSRCIAP